MDEIWKAIDDWPYEVSDQGRVRRSGPAPRAIVGRILKPKIDRYGYPTVNLRDRDRRWYPTIHILVSRAFIGPPLHGYQVNHINGIKADNRLVNLEYITAAENGAHAGRLGLKARGERNGWAKLTAPEVLEIRERYANGETDRQLARRFGVSKGCIYFIVSGKYWRHI